MAELHRRNVDGNPDVLRPRGRAPAGFAQHPYADRHDQAGVLGQANKAVGRHQAVAGPVPAQQRFRPEHPPGPKVNLRLVVQHQAPFSDRGTEITFHGVTIP